MNERAGRDYEIGIKSGGWKARFHGGRRDGGMVVSTLNSREARSNTAARARETALRAGTLHIKHSASKKIVWSLSALDLPPGQSIPHLMELIQHDLESLTARDFEQKWGIPETVSTPPPGPAWGLDAWANDRPAGTRPHLYLIDGSNLPQSWQEQDKKNDQLT